MSLTRHSAPAGSSSHRPVSWHCGWGLLCLTSILTFSATAQADESYHVVLPQPSVDSWFYPFASDPGSRNLAPTFGAFNSSSFDNRDGQFYMAFNTGANVPAGLDPARYVITSAKLTLSVSTGGGKVYDPTYDPVSTYALDGSPMNGDDPGRPMELFGAGYRNGVTSTSVTASTPFSTKSQPANRTRSVYPTDFIAAGSLSGSTRDVSNSVTDRLDTVPFAIGQVAPGDLQDNTIVEDGHVIFSLDLTNADILRYLRLSLMEGRIGLIATSLEQASQFGSVDYPNYYTSENTLGDAPMLELEVTVVPEPTTGGLWLLGASSLLLRRRRASAI